MLNALWSVVSNVFRNKNWNRFCNRSKDLPFLFYIKLPDNKIPSEIRDKDTFISSLFSSIFGAYFYDNDFKLPKAV